MVKKHYYSWKDIERSCISIVNQMYKDEWRPDYIVGITRGGNIPATIISNMTGIRCETLKVSLRDDDSESESNRWMAEDALGYNDGTQITASPLYKNILIVDDINDTGETIRWIQKDWQESCVPKDPKWDNIWNQNVKFAMLYENEASKIASDYNCKTVNKFEKDVWIVYPWERQYD